DELCALDDGVPGPAVDAVDRSGALYHGPFADEAPDLVVRLRDHATLCRIDGRGRDLLDPDGPLFVPADRPEHYRGAPRRAGFLAGIGPLVRRPAHALIADAADLTPTVLHCLDLPLDRELDGRVLGEMLVPALADRPVRHTAVPASSADPRPD